MEQSSQPAPAAANHPISPPAQSWRALIDNPRTLLLVLFLVTAALGLPFLWMSRAYNVWAKIILTLAVLAWTALVFWVFFLIMAWCWSRLEPVFYG